MPPVFAKTATVKPVLYAHETNSLTDVVECDVSTALQRGLAEYIVTQVSQYAGQQIKLASCYYEWAEQEDEVVFPTAAVRMHGDVTYDARTLSGPDINDSDEPDHANPRKRVAEVSEAIATLRITVRSNTPQQLRQLIKMLERSLAPVDWIYGVFITLPFYYNQRAAYAKEKVTYVDTPVTAQSRQREAHILVSARLMETEVYDAPFTEVRTGLTVE